ncbi:glycoside hydrolase family 36 protein [Xylogone sp. PMI_703]|nr:glycoside hydrolase family 36 protein [Xylogone sp. PMI_703]
MSSNRSATPAILTGDEGFQIQYILPQRTPPPPDDPSMKAYICSYPPLGQVTPIDKSTDVFTALLEVDESRATSPWQVSLWYSEGVEWKERPLTPVKSETTCSQSLQAPETTANLGLKKLYFTTPLAVHSPTKFTIKFRSGPEEPWKWVHDHQGIGDGVILLKSISAQDSVSGGQSLNHYIEGLNPSFKVENCRSQSPGTTLWSVEASIEPAVGESSVIKDVVFGLPWGKGKFLRWFALIRIWSPWLAPRQGKSTFELDKPGILCSFLNDEGQHLVLLALSGIDNVMTLFTSNNDGNVVLRVRNDNEETSVSRVLVALGDSFESANAAVMYHARKFVVESEKATGQEQEEMKALIEGVRPEWLENWYDGLTYCTWNALGQQLTEEKILKAVEILAEKKINITNIIIDDNWQNIDYRGEGQFQHGWNDFEAEPKAFPHGLKWLTQQIREKQPSIQHIAVWHALLGYWGGLAPDGKIAQTYKTVEIIREDSKRRNLPLGGKLTVIAKEDVKKFYDDFYRFLSSSGVDAVKTDAQFMTDTFVSAKARRELISEYLDAWTISTLRHFSIKAISCMSQTPHILFHSQLPQNRSPVLVRNSDDFFPEIPSSHPWHVWVNAHNSLFTQHLNVVPDWDMFQTVHDYSGFHAAARCVSGGPIYVTDVPGEHNLDLIRQMTGTSPRGKTVILRTNNLGKSLDQYNDYKDDTLLLVGTYHGSYGTGTGIIGVFNVSARPLTQLIPLRKFPGVIEAQYYIVRAHSSGRISTPLQIVDPLALLDISLDVRGYEILSSYPLRGFVDEKRDDTVWIANLGLLGKMSGAAAVVDTKMEKFENGRIEVQTNLKALGVVGFYISTLPTIDFKEHLLVTILGQVIPTHTVSVSKDDEHLLEIDAETAWEELGLSSRWSNDLEVKVFIN